MSFETYRPLRAHRASKFTGVTVSRFKTGVVCVAWDADVLPGVKAGDRVSLKLGTNEDIGKFALSATQDDAGYKVCTAIKGKSSPLKIVFTPPHKILNTARAEKVAHFSSGGILIASFSDGARDSFIAAPRMVA